MLFELYFIDGKVFVSFPDIVVILLDDVSVLKAHLYKSLDASLQQVPIHILSISILCNLVQNFVSQLFLHLDEAFFFEVSESTRGKALHATVFQEVAILESLKKALVPNN